LENYNPNKYKKLKHKNNFIEWAGIAI